MSSSKRGRVVISLKESFPDKIPTAIFLNHPQCPAHHQQNTATDSMADTARITCVTEKQANKANAIPELITRFEETPAAGDGMICHLHRFDIYRCLHKRVARLCIHGNPNQ
jgi:hypothetical protein